MLTTKRGLYPFVDAGRGAFLSAGIRSNDHSGHKENVNKLIPEADKEEYCNACDEALNDGKIVGDVVSETMLTYEDDEYKWIDHKDPIYNGIYKLWCSNDGLMPSEKMKLKAEFFTDSNFPWNSLG